MKDGERSSAGPVRRFIRQRSVLSHLAAVMMMVFALSFSCSGLFTVTLDEEYRGPQFRRHLGYGMIGPASQIIETRSVEGVVLLYLAIFALGLLGLTRMKFGCLSLLLGAVIAFCWTSIGLMVGGAPYW